MTTRLPPPAIIHYSQRGVAFKLVRAHRRLEIATRTLLRLPLSLSPSTTTRRLFPAQLTCTYTCTHIPAPVNVYIVIQRSRRRSRSVPRLQRIYIYSSALYSAHNGLRQAREREIEIESEWAREKEEKKMPTAAASSPRAHARERERERKPPTFLHELHLTLCTSPNLSRSPSRSFSCLLLPSASISLFRRLVCYLTTLIKPRSCTYIGKERAASQSNERRRREREGGKGLYAWGEERETHACARGCTRAPGRYCITGSCQRVRKRARAFISSDTIPSPQSRPILMFPSSIAR